MTPDMVAELLPRVMREMVAESPATQGLLTAMAEQLTPVEDHLADEERFFTPRSGRGRDVRMLAGWVHFGHLLDEPQDGSCDNNHDVDYAAGLGCLRELTAQAVSLAQVRGTAAGFIRYCEIATGLAGFHVHESDDPEQPFHIIVSAPRQAQPFRSLLERIMHAEMPAWVTSRLEFNSEESVRA